MTVCVSVCKPVCESSNGATQYTELHGFAAKV